MVVEIESWQEEREARIRRQQLGAREQLGAYLQSFPWSYFITVTTRKPWKDSISLNREAYRVLNEATAVERSFLCTEPYYLRGGVHLHGLVKADDKYEQFIPTRDIWQRLFTRFGRSKVEVVRSLENVTGYCSKYVTKSTGDYYFWGRKTFWEARK